MKHPQGEQRRRRWHPTPVFLPGKSHGWRSLVGCSPWGREESDTTKRLHFHFSLLCIGEGTGNPLQCSCLENPRDGGAWWAAVYGVAQSWTQLKRLSSSSSKVSKNDACASTDTQTNLCAHIPHSFTHFLSLSPSLCLGRPALLVNSPNAVCLVYSIHTSALHRFKRITTYQELCISKALPNTS